MQRPLELGRLILLQATAQRVSKIPESAFNCLGDFEREIHLTWPQPRPNIFIYLLGHADNAPLGNVKIEKCGKQSL